MAWQTSDKYNEVIYSGDAQHRLKLLFNDVEYTTANVQTESLKVTSKILTGGEERFSLDNFVSKEIELIIHDIDIEDIVEPISISIGTLVDEEYEYVPIGIFNLSENPTTDSGKTTIKARDNSVKFDIPYDASEIIEQSATNDVSMIDLLQDICTKCEVELGTLEFPNMNTKISVWDNTVNARQYIMYIAEKAGRIATIDRLGKLILVNLYPGEEKNVVSENGYIYINDALQRKIDNYSIFGNTYQQTYTGKNLFNVGSNTLTSYGITAIYNKSNFLLNGTSTSGHEIFLLSIGTIKAGTYTIQSILRSGTFNLGNNHTFAWVIRNSSSQITTIGTGTFNGIKTFTLNSDKELFIQLYINGDNVSFNGCDIDIQLEKGSTATSYEPFVGGTKSPNPDYPQEIKTVTGRQEINIVGKNLFNSSILPERTALGVTSTFNNNVLTLNGTSTGEGNFYQNSATEIILQPGTYTFSAIKKSGSATLNNHDIVIYIRKSDGSALSGLTLSSILNNNGSNTFTITETTSLIFRQYTNSSNIVLNNLILELQLEKGSVVSEYEEYKGQSYEINLGKNLLDVSKGRLGTFNGLTISYSNEEILLNGTATALVDFYVATKVSSQATTYNEDLINYMNNNIGSYTLSNNLGFENYFRIGGSYPQNIGTTTSTNKVDLIFVRIPVGTYNNQVLKIQLEKGTQATTYSEYFEPIELNKIGEYQDRIYKQNNKWYVEKKIGKIVLDGTENWIYQANYDLTNTKQFSWRNAVNTNSNIGLSNYFKRTEGWRTLTNTDEDMIQVYSDKAIYIRINNTLAPDLATFKTWLSTHNTEFYYALATPTYTEITNTELIEQLNAVLDEKLNKGVNNITITSSDLPGQLDMTYLVEKEVIELNPLLFEKYTVGDEIEISRVVYEDAIRKFEYGIEDNQTLYINSANPYIVNGEEIENIYEEINGFNISSMNISKMIGNPALDSYDIIKFTYNDETYKTFAQNTLTYNGVITQTFDTQLGSKEKAQENVTIVSGDTKFKRVFTKINQVEGDLELNTSQIVNVQTDLQENYYTKEQANILIQNAETGVTNTFSEAGGNNIFRNTGLWFADDKVTEYIYPNSELYPSYSIYPLASQHYEYWDGYVEKIKNENSSNMSAMLLKQGYLEQKQDVPNGSYTVSFKYQKLIGLATCKVIINNIEYNLTEMQETEFVTGKVDNEGNYIIQPLDVSNREIAVKFYCDTDNACQVYDLMVNAGGVKLAYSQNQNETSTDTVNISKGITITSTDTDTIFKANADGIRTLNSDGTLLTEFTDTGMSTKKMKVTEEAQICGVLVQPVNGQTWFTKL